MATKKPARNVRSKAETKAALDEIQDVVARQEPIAPKEMELQMSHRKEVLDGVKDLSVETAVQKVTSVGLEVSRSLAAVSEQLVAQTQQLAQVKEAIALEKAELERLYTVDIVASSIETLLADYKTKEADLAKEAAEKRAEFNAETTEREEEIENEENERIAHIAEEDAERKKNREREESDYQYNLAVSRMKDKDAFAALIDKRNREESIRASDLARNWAERENILKAKELELSAAQSRIAGLPAEFEKIKLEAIAETTRQLNSSKHFEVSHLKKDMDAATAMANMQIASLRDANTTLANQIAKLSIELSSANAQVKSIAEKALDSSSGQRTLAEVTSLMQNQQGNGAPRGKS